MDPSAASSYRVKSEIQPQPLEQEPVTPIDQSREKRNLEDEIFNAAMENKWTKVKKLYMENESLRTTKLTRSEDTALHLAISSYHPDRYTSLHHPHLLCIKDMITNIPKKNRECILKQKNEKGNTPLHLAAEVGSVPIIECLVNSKEPELIKETNEKGETPLFITASRCKQDAFLYLHKCCQNEHEEGPIELCRRKDGDNILHVAISGEYFELAFQIIHYYKPLVNHYNTQGMSPLHILSRMPQVFRSGNRFRFIDSIIYYSTTVKELEKETHKAERKIDLYQKIQRCGTKKFIDYIKEAYRGNKSKDLTGVTNVNQATKPQDATGVTNENQDKKYPAEGKGNRRLFTANYAIFIDFLKCLMKIVLLVSGIGLERIKKIKERKSKRRAGVQIMKLMIEKEKRYQFYKNTGEKPANLYSRDRYKQIGAPPPAPPETEEDVSSNTAAIKQSQTSSTDEIKTDDSKSELPTTKETPLLVASKMGILEMVRRILKKFPIAIQDTDSEEKNILLLTVEHRQTMVYNWLIEEKYPESVFSQEDKHGNNALHIAAKYQNLEVWRIPGKALQLQGEWKWYKYVKHTLPQLDVRYNKKGQTPRRVFEEMHAKLLVESTEWIRKTAASLAALIATVAFVTSTTIPGEADVKDKPHLENEPAFDVFSIASLVSLCFSVTALVFFLAILTSRCQHNDFEKDLPRKLLLGLTSLFASITAILVSFCAAHFFVIRDNFKNAAFTIYAATCVPVVLFAFNQFPLYVDLIRSYIQKLPLRSYKVFYTISSEATSSDQKKEKEEDD
ncbi:hypothetical protein BC332_31362 [Capsicum chinense]|nr:hypothetical protein BC332_31362 [Capsicum chinense]